MTYCCPKCGNPLSVGDVESYPFVCHECDENFYMFEAVWKEGMSMTKRAASHAWDLYDIITDFAYAYPQLLHVHTPKGDYDGTPGVTHTTYRGFMWDVFMEFFERDFDANATMEAICDSYGVPNLYEDNEKEE